MAYRFTKRVVDIVGSIFGLVVFSPLFLICALAIKLTSRGPVLVEHSDRVGQGGKIFRMYKFRSMIKDAHILIRTDPKLKKLYEQYRRNSFKLDNDPRVTSVGRFLRRTSLDELPQFLNVLKGDMSLVGPRAYYPDEIAEQRKIYPQCRSDIETTLSVKPGMTGLWQVSGRSDIGFEKRIDLDASYARAGSILLDLKIILKTPSAVLKGEAVS